jgi:AcrR family transcriptional regulator
MQTDDTSPRTPLTRERVLRAAIAVADRNGLDALTMRRLGDELGVAAMSVYKHVANKEEILEGIIELIVGEIEIPGDGIDWKEAMWRRAFSAREVLGRHSWAIGLIEARGSTGRNARRYMEAIIGNLRSAGFSIENAAHAFWLIDSYVYGHVIQETDMPVSGAGSEVTVLEQPTDEYPHLVELGEHALRSGFSFDNEFRFGLDLILDALDETMTSESDQGNRRA